MDSQVIQAFEKIGDSLKKLGEAVVKGDSPGHPFRGNQYSGGGGGGSSGSSAASLGFHEMRKQGKNENISELRSAGISAKITGTSGGTVKIRQDREEVMSALEKNGWKRNESHVDDMDMDSLRMDKEDKSYLLYGSDELTGEIETLAHLYAIPKAGQKPGDTP